MPLSFKHILHSIIALDKEKEKEDIVEDKELFLLLVFYTFLVEFYTEEVLSGFLPCGFPEENICVLFCCCACLSFNDHFLMVMML